MDHINTFKVIITGITAGLTALWGWMGWLVFLWLGCLAVDYLTGSLAAVKAGEWSSKAAREGIWHKVGSVIAVAVAAGADLLIGLITGNIPGLTFTYSVLLCPLVVVWYIITELGSLVENALKLGAPVPEFLKKALEMLKEESEKEK